MMAASRSAALVAVFMLCQGGARGEYIPTEACSVRYSRRRMSLYGWVICTMRGRLVLTVHCKSVIVDHQLNYGMYVQSEFLNNIISLTKLQMGTLRYIVQLSIIDSSVALITFAYSLCIEICEVAS